MSKEKPLQRRVYEVTVSKDVEVPTKFKEEAGDIIKQGIFKTYFDDVMRWLLTLDPFNKLNNVIDYLDDGVDNDSKPTVTELLFQAKEKLIKAVTETVEETKEDVVVKVVEVVEDAKETVEEVIEEAKDYITSEMLSKTFDELIAVFDENFKQMQNLLAEDMQKINVKITDIDKTYLSLSKRMKKLEKRFDIHCAKKTEAEIKQAQEDLPETAMENDIPNEEIQAIDEKLLKKVTEITEPPKKE